MLRLCTTALLSFLFIPLRPGLTCSKQQKSVDEMTVTARRGRGGGRGRAALQRAAFEGQKFGILAFALQRVSVSLYLFLNLSSALRMGVAGWRGGTADLCSGRQKPSRRHWWAGFGKGWGGGLQPPSSTEQIDFAVAAAATPISLSSSLSLSLSHEIIVLPSGQAIGASHFRRSALDSHKTEAFVRIGVATKG